MARQDLRIPPPQFASLVPHSVRGPFWGNIAFGGAILGDVKSKSLHAFLNRLSEVELTLALVLMLLISATAQVSTPG